MLPRCCHLIFGSSSSFQSRVLFDCSPCAMIAVACMIACVDMLVYVCVPPPSHCTRQPTAHYITMSTRVWCRLHGYSHCNAHCNAFNHCHTSCAHTRWTLWWIDRPMSYVCNLLAIFTDVSDAVHCCNCQRAATMCAMHSVLCCKCILQSIRCIRYRVVARGHSALCDL